MCSDSDFIFIDDNFNPKGHFIELADGTRSNNVAKERGTVVISLRTKEGNLVKATLEEIKSLEKNNKYCVMELSEGKKLVTGSEFAQLRKILKNRFTTLVTLQKDIAKFMGLIILKLLHRQQGWN